MWENGSTSYQQREPLGTGPQGGEHVSIVPRNEEEHQCRAVVETSTLFSGILPGDYARIAASAHIKVFSQGQMLQMEGDSVQRVLLLTSGLVKVAFALRVRTCRELAVVHAPITPLPEPFKQAAGSSRANVVIFLFASTLLLAA